MNDLTFDRHDLLDAFHAGIGVGAEIMLKHTGESLTPELEQQISDEAVGEFIEVLKSILVKQGLRLERKKNAN